MIAATGCVQNVNNYYQTTDTTESENFPQLFTISNFTEQEVGIYLKGDKINQTTLYFPLIAEKSAELKDLPYVDFLAHHQKTVENKEYTSTVISADEIEIKETNGSQFSVIFNNKEQSIYFLDYDEFRKSINDGGIIDMVSEMKDYIIRDKKSFTRNGKSIKISLKRYGIPMVFQDDKVFIPLQTYNDLFCNPNRISLIFKNNKLHFNHVLNDESFYDEGAGKIERSEELIQFNYNELCLNMDVNYGLKEVHDIDDFNYFFCDTGLVSKLRGIGKNYSSAYDFNVGIFDLAVNYFADFHSSFSAGSYYYGKSSLEVPEGFAQNPAYLQMVQVEQYYNNIRKSVYEKKGLTLRTSQDSGVNDYFEDNNTAYITFDSFSFGNIDYKELTNNGTEPLALEDVNDTIGLVIYANQRIRENPNITNIVFDVSNNGGGAVNSLAYITAWILGKCTLNLKSTFTGGMSSITYAADLDFDGIADSLNDLTDESGNPRSFKVYCITSPFSFSCGNYFPALLKQSGKVTILGKTSGGGACIVYSTSSADTTRFSISSCVQFCTVKNGSFYQVDTGVTPDYVINDFANLYDREKLTLYIDGLF